MHSNYNFWTVKFAYGDDVNDSYVLNWTVLVSHKQEQTFLPRISLLAYCHENVGAAHL